MVLADMIGSMARMASETLFLPYRLLSSARASANACSRVFAPGASPESVLRAIYLPPPAVRESSLYSSWHFMLPTGRVRFLDVNPAPMRSGGFRHATTLSSGRKVCQEIQELCYSFQSIKTNHHLEGVLILRFF